MGPRSAIHHRSLAWTTTRNRNVRASLGIGSDRQIAKGTERNGTVTALQFKNAQPPR